MRRAKLAEHRAHQGEKFTVVACCGDSRAIASPQRLHFDAIEIGPVESRIDVVQDGVKDLPVRFSDVDMIAEPAYLTTKKKTRDEAIAKPLASQSIAFERSVDLELAKRSFGVECQLVSIDTSQRAVDTKGSEWAKHGCCHRAGWRDDEFDRGFVGAPGHIDNHVPTSAETVACILFLCHRDRLG